MNSIQSPYLKEVNEKVRQAHFFLDYLRLHQLGKKQKVFKKNREMMKADCADDSKTGYKSYIYRMIKSFLDQDFTHTTVTKPRGLFSYHFGIDSKLVSRGGYNLAVGRFLPISKSNDFKIMYLFRRHLLYREDTPKVIEYVNTLDSMKYIKPMTYKMFHKVVFCHDKSKGYDALMELYTMKNAYLALLETYNPEKHLKDSIAALLNKTMKVKMGQTAYLFNDNGLPDLLHPYQITNVRASLDGEGNTTSVDISLNGLNYTTSRGRILPVFDGDNSALIKEREKAELTIEEFYKFFIETTNKSTGLSLDQTYKVALFIYALQNPAEKDVLDSYDSSILITRLREDMLSKGIQEPEYIDNQESYTVTDIEDIPGPTAVTLLNNIFNSPRDTIGVINERDNNRSTIPLADNDDNCTT